MPTFAKRNGRVFVQVAINGIRKSKTFDTKQDAMIWAATTEADILNGDSVHDRASGHTFADALNQYLEIYTPIKRGSHNEMIIANRLLTETWVHKKLTVLKLKDLTNFRDNRLKTIKPSTFKREWALVKSVVAKANRFDIDMPFTVFDGLELPRVFEREISRISDNDLKGLLDGALAADTLNNYLHPLIRFALGTAMRRAEILSLEWQDVDLDNRRVTVTAPKAKSGYRRTIPLLNEDGYQALLELKSMAGDSDFVVNKSDTAVKSSYKRLQKRTGMKHIRFHDFRHEAISRLHEKGLTLPEIQEISGHRDIEMLQRYSHASTASIEAKLQGANNV